jgi:4-hydroxybenzoate polyprenyltransferase
VKREDALIFGITLSVASVSVSGIIGELVPIFAGIAVIFGLFYNGKMRRKHGLIASMTFAGAIAFASLVGWFTYCSYFDLKIILLFVTFLLLATAQITTNHFVGYKEDAKIGYRTLPVIYGIEKTSKIVLMFRILGFTTATLLLIFANLLNFASFMLLLFAFFLSFVIHRALKLERFEKAFRIGILQLWCCFFTLLGGIYL